MTTVSDATSGVLGAAAQGAGGAGSADTQNRFLSLLVAQMKNQDPLNPLDNAQVTSQMAQLSTVQGIESMNKTLAALSASMGANQISQAASLIGRGVLVPGNSVSPAQSRDLIGFDLAEPVDQMKVSILNGSGSVVRQLDLGAKGPGMGAVAWDGMQDNGSPAPAGAYTFKIEASQAGQAVSAMSLMSGVVASVSQSQQGAVLNLAGSQTASFADVRQIF